MENNQINQPKNVWKPIAIVAISVSVILLGLSIFLLVQNSNQRAQINSQNDKSDVSDQTEDNTNVDKKPDTDISDNSQTSTDYLVIEEWGVKFKIPEGLQDPIYSYSLDDHGGYITVTTLAFNAERCQALGELTHSADPNFFKENGGPNRSPDFHFDGYYYFYGSPQSACTTDKQNIELQTVELIRAMLTTAPQRV